MKKQVIVGYFTDKRGRVRPVTRTVNVKRGELRFMIDDRSPIIGYKPNYRQLIWMSPDQFLKLCVPPMEWYEPSLAWLRKQFREGKPVEPLFLDIRTRTGEAYKHEGRHRAKVCKELGIERIPVFVYHRDSEGYLTEPTRQYKAGELRLSRKKKREFKGNTAWHGTIIDLNL
jgi:hypothetical protein